MTPVFDSEMTALSELPLSPTNNCLRQSPRFHGTGANEQQTQVSHDNEKPAIFQDHEDVDQYLSTSVHSETSDKENMCAPPPPRVDPLKRATDNMDKVVSDSATLGETFTLSEGGTDTTEDSLLHFTTMEDEELLNSLRMDSLSFQESRDCSITRNEGNAMRSMSTPFDEKRDDVSFAPKFLIETRVEYTHFPEPGDSAIMFLATSSESWDDEVARETSLFDTSSSSGSSWEGNDDEVTDEEESIYTEAAIPISLRRMRVESSSSVEGDYFDPITKLRSAFVSTNPFLHVLFCYSLLEFLSTHSSIASARHVTLCYRYTLRGDET